MTSTFRPLLVAAFAILALSRPAFADDLVKQAQVMLNALGYKVGTPDGDAGKKTLGAIEKVLAKYGQPFDGELSGNELEILARLVPAQVDVDFGTTVSETYLLASGDINDDGRTDLLVNAMADPSAQLGIECCEVPASRLAELVPPVPQLIYSTPTGYAAVPLPAETKGNRTWAAKFFDSDGKHYVVLGRNGEMGLPDENDGEYSILVEIDPSTPVPTMSIGALFPWLGVTTSVEVADLDGNGRLEIFQNNYNVLRAVADEEGSGIVELLPDETLRESKVFVDLEEGKAHNYISFRDLDGNGVLDILASGEVIKSNDGKQIMAKVPGSYLLLNPWDVKAPKRVYLSPPHYGFDHSAFSLAALQLPDRLLVLEVSMQFLGHEAGGFNGFNLDVFDVSLNDDGVKLVTNDVLPRPPEGRGAAGNYLGTADIDFDGTDEVWILKYTSKPEYLDWDGKKFVLKRTEATSYFKPEWAGMQTYLPDRTLDCTRVVTFPEFLGGGKEKMKVNLSTCLPMSGG
jgi:peptidoglycan hydrolase-like protein with peptidoglycan-binding domain